MPTPLEVLNAERAASKARLAESRAAVRAATRQEQRAAAAEARQWQLDWRQRLVCLIAYAHAGFDAEPAARFLAIDGEGRGWRGKPEEERCRLVEDLFLEVDLEELGRLCDTDVIADARAMNVAVRYVEEWRLVCWARCRSESPVGAPPFHGCRAQTS